MVPFWAMTTRAKEGTAAATPGEFVPFALPLNAPRFLVPLFAASLACQAKPTPTEGKSATPAVAYAASATPTTNPSANAARALALKREAFPLLDQYEFDRAKAKILDAQKLTPDDADLKTGLVAIDEMNATKVAGRWFKSSQRDAMTDRVNVSVRLPASDGIPTEYSEKRPFLIARCTKGKPDLLIQVDLVVGGDIYSNAKASYRFDSEAPQTATMTTAEDHEGLFFKEPLKWFDRVVAHATGKLVVEVPLYGRVPVPVTFDLAGADTAIPPVKACSS